MNENIEKILIKISDRLYELDWELTMLKKDFKNMSEELEMLKGDVDNLKDGTCECDYDDSDIKVRIDSLEDKIINLYKILSKKEGDEK